MTSEDDNEDAHHGHEVAHGQSIHEDGHDTHKAPDPKGHGHGSHEYVDDLSLLFTGSCSRAFEFIRSAQP